MADNSATATKVITGKVRLSYVHLLKPHAIEPGQESKYSASIIIPKSDKKTIKAIQSAVAAATQLGKTSKWGGKIPSNLKNPLRDGDDERSDDEAYQDAYFVNAYSKTQPGMIDRHKNEIMDPEEIYSGMYARVSLNFYPYDIAGGRGVAAGLNNLQKVADGPYLGGRISADAEFDEYDDDDDYDPLLG